MLKDVKIFALVLLAALACYANVLMIINYNRVDVDENGEPTD